MIILHALLLVWCTASAMSSDGWIQAANWAAAGLNVGMLIHYSGRTS